MTAPDLEALEKLADEASMARGLWDEIHCLNKFHDHADPATIKALIAELREARRLMKPFAVYYEINDLDERLADDTIEVPVGDLRLVRAFLARNGKADLQKMQNNTPRNAPRGLSDEC